MKYRMVNDRNHFVLRYLLLLFAIHYSNSQCASEMCEKKSLSLKTDTKQDSSLEGYVFETLNFSIWEECFNMCVRKCQCLSFNFNEVNKTDNCELNDVNTKQAPEALKERSGVIYYEPDRSYPKMKVGKCDISRLFSDKKIPETKLVQKKLQSKLFLLRLPHN